MSIFSRLSACLLAGLAMSLTLSQPARAASAKEVDAALKKAIDCLYAKQNNGNWEIVASPKAPPQRDSVDGGQWGGLTGVTTYALLSAEQDPQDPRIAKAVDFLQNAEMRGVYAISVRAQVWPLVARVRKVKSFAERDLHLLLNGAKTKGPGRGMWLYYVDQPNDLATDNSASQFAVLGVWACEEAGVEVPSAFWQTEDTIWRHNQIPGGSWSYVANDAGAWGQPCFSMTLAGLASLYITQEKMTRVASRCNALPADSVLDAGIKYIGQNYPDSFENPPPGLFTPGSGKRQLYVLFGLSRLGLASGMRYFGNKDWFKTGADYLVKTQAADGSWGENWETAMGVLFLARGRAPVAFNKLEYDSQKKPPVQDWDVRPRDVANLATWMGKSLERRINWQVVNIDTNPDEWLDAPILYVAGPDELKFSADQMTKLKQFVHDGGMILGNPDCASGKFTTSFKKLGTAMFPGYEWAELPATHPIYTREQFVRTRWKSKPHLLALSNGVRVLMLFSPEADLGRTYAVQDDHSKPEAFQLGVDLYEYMAGLDLRHRGDTNLVVRDPGIASTKTVKIARLKYTGNWDPEPGSWLRMSAILHNQNKLNVTVDAVDLGAKLTGYSVAHLTGTAPITLTPAQKSSLTDFVNGGGTLLVDAAGGSSDFATAMESQIGSLLPTPFSVLPPEAPLYTQGDNPIKTFTYTRLTRATLGTLKTPRLKAIAIKGRPAILFSADDLTAGLLGQPIDGIVGYSPDTAVDIVRKIVLASAPAK